MAKADKHKIGKSSLKSATESNGPKVSDALRQAVKDLGGDDEDLELIAGIDSDDERSQPAGVAAKGKGKEALNEEKSLRKALGAFMKELDFASVNPQTESEDDQESEEEDISSGESDEDQEEDGVDVAEPVTQATPTNAKLKAGATQVTDEPSTLVAGDKEPTSASRVPASPSWSALVPNLPPFLKEPKPIAPNRLQSLKSKGQHLLDSLPPLSRSSSSSDAAFISQILQNGTHQDRLAALVLLVRESPLHAMKELGRLRTMSGCKEDGTIGGGGNKDQRLAVVKSLVDWWVSGGGKEAGKLKYFADQPFLSHPEITDRHLLIFAFEDWLKRWFFNILQVLESLSHDTLPYIRVQALHLISQLLSGNAEQEQNLLRLGVNKLGDSDRSVASQASHHLLQLLQVHPAMKGVVVREISALVLKLPNQTAATASQSTHVRFDEPAPTSAKAKGKAKAEPPKSDPVTHARYYGVLTLTQIVLTSKDRHVAAGLVELYFELFREILGEGLRKEKQEPLDSVDALGQDEIEKAVGKVETWRGRRKKVNPKEARKSALEKEQDIVDAGEARLVAALLSGINRAVPFAKLDESAFEKYMNTLFLITHTGSFNTTIQALQLVFQICSQTAANSTSTSSQSIDRFYRTMYDSLFDVRLMTSSKQAMYLNLMFKALKADTQVTRVMAFVKRLLQALGLHQPPFICGTLYCLGELFETTPGLRRMLIEPEDDGDEHFVDASEERDVKQANGKTAREGKVYDGRKREPLYAHADTTCLWELLPFTDHFHPSVSLQAQQLLMSQPISGSPDISLNTLVSFLDRFVYRNPKKNLQPKGASIMQPSAASDRTGMLVQNKGARALDSGYVNDEKFWKKSEAEVPADQLFFHKFFATKLANGETKARSKRALSDEEVDISDADEQVIEASEGEEDSVAEKNPAADGVSQEGSELDEDEVWEAMVRSMPGGELDESDDEVDLSDTADTESDDELESADIQDDEVEEDADVGISEEDDSDGEEDEEDKDEADSEGFPDVEEDEDDLVPLDEMPDIILDPTAPSGSDEDDEEASKKGKRKRAGERKERRKKRKEMPMFASYEDYQAMIEGAPSEED